MIPEQLPLSIKYNDILDRYTSKDGKELVEYLQTLPSNTIDIVMAYVNNFYNAVSLKDIRIVVKAYDKGIDVLQLSEDYRIQKNIIEYLKGCEQDVGEQLKPYLNKYNWDELSELRQACVQGVADKFKPFLKLYDGYELAEIRKALVAGANENDLDKGYSISQLKMINKCLKNNKDISKLNCHLTVNEIKWVANNGSSMR